MNKKVKFLSVVTTLAMAASMGATAFATSAGQVGSGDGTIGGTLPADQGTEVWAGVAVDAPDMRIKVTVPTLFAFVVNGTIDAGAATAEQNPTADNGGLLLPNVKVENAKMAGATAAAGDSYDITTSGEETMLFENFSTQYNGTNYDGLEVKVTGTIRNEGTEASRNGWSHVGSKPSTTKGADYKKYQLTVTDLEGNGGAFVSRVDGSFAMEKPITLEAPNTLYDGTDYGNLDTTTNLAATGAVVEAKFGVAVGGVRSDYNKIENSAKIGTISWDVSADHTLTP